MITQKDRHLLYIASREIERCVSQQLLRSPKSYETAPADRLPQFGQTQPTLVGAYYDLCFQYEDTPTQQVYVDFYVQCHEAEFQQITPTTGEAMKARCARAYNTFVLEHQLLALCVESGQFDACYKAESLDTMSMVDMAIRLGLNHYGFAIQMPTRNARYWIGEKDRRQANRGLPFRWPVKAVSVDFNQMKVINRLHWFTPRYGVNLIANALRQMRMELET